MLEELQVEYNRLRLYSSGLEKQVDFMKSKDYIIGQPLPAHLALPAPSSGPSEDADGDSGELMDADGDTDFASKVDYAGLQEGDGGAVMQLAAGGAGVVDAMGQMLDAEKVKLQLLSEIEELKMEINRVHVATLDIICS